MKATKQSNPINLSDYAEEAVPFDTVIRKIMRAPPHHIEAPKHKKKSTKNTAKRKA